MRGMLVLLMLLWLVLPAAAVEIEIVAPGTQARVRPDEFSPSVRLLGTGKRYEVREERNGWVRIELFSGDAGWVPQTAIRYRRGTLACVFDHDRPGAEYILPTLQRLTGIFCEGAGLDCVADGAPADDTLTISAAARGLTRAYRDDDPWYTGAALDGAIALPGLPRQTWQGILPAPTRYARRVPVEELRRPQQAPYRDALARSDYVDALHTLVAARHGRAAADAGLTAAVQAREAEVRIAALLAASRRQGEQATAIVAAAVAQETETRSHAAVLSLLGVYGGVAGLPVLMATLDDTLPLRRSAALSGLGAWTNRHADSDPAVWLAWWTERRPLYAPELLDHAPEHDTLMRAGEAAYWQQVQATPDMLTCRDFLAAFPESAHAAAARELLCAAEWTRALRLDAARHYREYLDRWPGTTPAAEAEQHAISREVDDIFAGYHRRWAPPKRIAPAPSPGRSRFIVVNESDYVLTVRCTGAGTATFARLAPHDRVTWEFPDGEYRVTGSVSEPFAANYAGLVPLYDGTFRDRIGFRPVER